MNELQLMNKKIEILSVVLGVLAALIAGILFKDVKIAIAVVLGLAIALIGYAMIVRMTVTMGDNERICPVIFFIFVFLEQRPILASR